MADYPPRRGRLLPWLLGLLLLGGIAGLSLLIRENAAAEIGAAPRYTQAPDWRVPTDTGREAPPPTAAPESPLAAAGRQLFSWLPPVEFAPDPPDAAAGRQSAAAPLIPVTYTLFLPLTAQDYTLPPRTMEPFRVLATAAGEWPAAAEALSRSKLGLHTLGPSDPAIMEFIRRTRPRVVKSVGSFGWLTEVKAVSPETITIGRLYGQDENWVNQLDPRSAADQYITERLDQYELNPGVDYWEGWNEFVYDTPEKLRWYADFEAARACQMRALGYRAAVGSFAVGWPLKYADMALFLPALEAAHRCGGLLTLHEYNKPLLQCGVRSGEAGIIPGAPAIHSPAGPLTFRYRFWYEGYLQPRGLGDLPLVLSEYGIDGVPAIDCTDPYPTNGATWKDYSGWWVTQGLGGDGPAAYVNQLAWADREMQYDSYVLGATIFSAGALSSQWEPYDLHDVLIPLANYLNSTR